MRTLEKVIVAMAIVSGCTTHRLGQRLDGIVAVTALDDGVQVEPGPGFREQAGRRVALKPGEHLSISDGHHVAIDLQFKGRENGRYAFRIVTNHRPPTGPPSRIVEYVAVSAYAPANPRDENLISARLSAILPKRWRIVRIERNTHPFLRPEGNGIGVFLAPADFTPIPKSQGDDWKVAIYVMPPDYEDGGADPTGGQAQTWPPMLAGANEQMKIYVWGGWDGQTEEMRNQVRDSLMK